MSSKRTIHITNKGRVTASGIQMKNKIKDSVSNAFKAKGASAILAASFAALMGSAASAEVAFVRAVELANTLPPSNGWVADRSTPDTIAYGTVHGRDDVMTIGIDSVAVGADTFRRTEGVKQIIHNGTAAEVDVFLDSAWQNKAVRAGFWVSGETEAQDAASSWGIIEFVTGANVGPASNATTETGFRFWDSRNPGAWEMTTVDLTNLWGKWVTLRIELDVVGQKYDYFIDGVGVGSFPFESDDITKIREVIFQAYDYGADNEAGTLADGFSKDPYNVSWSALELDAQVATISEALSFAAPGAVLTVAPGTYAENIIIDKAGITLDGPGATIEVASGAAISIAADNVSLIGLDLVKTGSPAGYGIDVAGSGAVTRNNLTLSGISATNFNSGFKVNDTTSIDGLTVTSSRFNNNVFGWYLSKSPANGSTVTNVSVTDTSFNDNGSKGIYAEKLDNATFTNIEVINSGTDLVTWPPSNGVDINLKWSDYSNITIQDSFFQNGGLYTESLQGNLAGVLVIKARSDGSYASPAATLSNVQLLNNTFTASNPLSIVGVRLGEPTKDNAGPTNVTITGNVFSGYKTPLLNTTVSPLPATMVAANTFTDNHVKLVRGSTTPAVYTSFADAIAASADGDILDASGTFTGDITLAKPNLTLDGNSSTFMTGMVRVNAAGATVTGMDITNPAGLAGVYVKRVGGATITNNNLHAIGTTNAGNAIQAIYIEGGASGISDIEIRENDITNVGNPAAAYSNKGIHFGDAGSAAFTISQVEVVDNTISGVNAASNKGGYGISFNYGSSSTGVIDDLLIAGNEISAITGGWVHAIGLETHTTNTRVTSNTISNLTASGSDEAGIFFEKNPGITSMLITGNKITGATQGIASHPSMSALAVKAERNYWGGGSPTVSGPAIIDFNPWWTNPAMGPTHLSSYVAPAPTPPVVDPTVPTPGDVEEIVDTIVIPPADSGESISDEVIAVVQQAAAATTGLANNIVQNIATVDTNTAIDALATIGNVVNVSGNAATNTSGAGNAGGSTSTVASGATALNSFSSLLSAIDAKANDASAPAALSDVQKNAVQQATIQAAASAVQMLAAAPAAADKKEVLASLGKIISSNVNLGVPLTSAQSTTLLAAADQASSEDDDAETQLDNSIPLTPQNKDVISRDLLAEALQGSGVTAAELDTFLAELAAAINPADVNVGSTNGADALESGFNGAFGNDGAVSFNADTGTTSFTLGGGTSAQSLNGRTLHALTVERTIPGRVISSNVVASSFPDGVRLKGDGSAVITNNRIASVVVPASYDPINFYADLRKLGVTAVDTLGNVTIDDGGSFHFSGTFDYVGITSGGAAVASTKLVAPTGQDEADLNFVYQVVYRDGTLQNIQPYLIDDNFVASARGQGLVVSIDRNNGVVDVNGLRFRPSYFVDDHTAATLAFWNEAKDAHGMAYQPVDINLDGKVDYRVLSETGFQVAYGL